MLVQVEGNLSDRKVTVNVDKIQWIEFWDTERSIGMRLHFGGQDYLGIEYETAQARQIVYNKLIDSKVFKK